MIIIIVTISTENNCLPVAISVGKIFPFNENKLKD